MPALPSTLTSKSHLPTEQQIALENAVEAIIGVFWMATDLAGGEFECGPDHCDREVQAVDDAMRAVYALAGRTVSRNNRATDPSSLRAAFALRLAENEREFSKEAE